MGQYNKTPKVHVVRDDFMSVSPTKKYMKIAIRRRGCLHPTRLYESQTGFDETD